MRILNVRLWKWFPSDDGFSAEMARLCILREDLTFELKGAIESKNVPITDGYGHFWRLLYFVRKMSITLEEIRRTIDGLSLDRDFKNFLANQSKNFKKDIGQVKTNLKLARNTIKEIRNNVGGAHIVDKSIKEALQSMNYERLGILQISRYSPWETHYKFTGEMLMALLFRNVPDEQQEDRANEIVSMLENTLKELFVPIDILFLTYAKDRNLL